MTPLIDKDNQKVLNELRTKRGVWNFNPRDHPISFIEVRHEGFPKINKNVEDVQSQIELLYDDAEENEREKSEFI